MILKWIKKMCSSAQEKYLVRMKDVIQNKSILGMLLWVYAVV